MHWHLYNTCNAGNVTDIDFYHIYISTRKLYNLTIQRCDFCTHHFLLVWIDETSSVEAKSDHYWVVVAHLVAGIQVEVYRTRDGARIPLQLKCTRCTEHLNLNTYNHSSRLWWFLMGWYQSILPTVKQTQRICMVFGYQRPQSLKASVIL